LETGHRPGEYQVETPPAPSTGKARHETANWGPDVNDRSPFNFGERTKPAGTGQSGVYCEAGEWTQESFQKNRKVTNRGLGAAKRGPVSPDVRKKVRKKGEKRKESRA